MTRKKTEPAGVENKTRQVKVNAFERREYIEEEPIVSTDPAADVFSDDPFAEFNQIVTDNKQATVHIWRLPNYEVDGRTSPNGTEREYCGSIIYQQGDDTLLHQIQQRVPMGGVVSLELKQSGQYQSSGLLKIIRPPNVPMATQQHGFPPITINQPNPQHVIAKPFEGVKEAFSLLREMGETMKAVMPLPPIIPAATNGAEQQPSIKDRILEGVIIKAFEGDKVPSDRFDRVLDVLGGGGRNEPGIVESIVQGVAPHLGTFLQGISSGLNALLMRLATGTPVVEATVSSQTASIAGALTEGQQRPTEPIDPAEYAWQRTLGRILDDLFEHVSAIVQARAPVDVHSSAEAIIDLGSRFQANEQITATIDQLLTLPPDQVIDLCTTMVPGKIQPHVAELKKSQAAILWLVELQNETKAILADNQGESTSENETERIS